ncbi:MAG: FAD-binding protein, partial [Flavobacterium sp.]
MKYDVIVVGSGATGGIAAMELTAKGLNILVLEAGPYLKEELFHQKGSGFKNIGSMPRVIAAAKGQFLQARASFYAPEKAFLFVNDFKDRYTWSKDFFLWIRSKNVGGRFQSW